jgi:hypothetical protein
VRAGMRGTKPLSLARCKYCIVTLVLNMSFQVCFLQHFISVMILDSAVVRFLLASTFSGEIFHLPWGWDFKATNSCFDRLSALTFHASKLVFSLCHSIEPRRFRHD